MSGSWCVYAVYALKFALPQQWLVLKELSFARGAFHVVLNFFAVVGSCFGDDGLRDVLIKANVLASGSVDEVQKGRHYNQGPHVHKLVSEALGRMRWSAFRK